MTVIERPKKQQFTLVEMHYGRSLLPNPAPEPSFNPGIVDDPTYIRLTDNASEVTVDGNVYSPVPAMEIKLPTNTGLLDEKPCDILLPESAIDSEIVTGPFPPLHITVRNLVREDVDEELTYHFVGKLHRTVRNYRGKDGQALLQGVSWKNLLKVRPGLLATHQCQWSLFGKGCVTIGSPQDPEGGATPPGQSPFIGASGAVSYCEVASISGQEVTVDLIQEVTGRDKYWYRGFLEHRGLRITIIDWDETYSNQAAGRATTTFILEEKPPASWDGQIMRAFPGCDKFVETCENTWENKPNFSGVGYAILSYNPMIESGS